MAGRTINILPKQDIATVAGVSGDVVSPIRLGIDTLDAVSGIAIIRVYSVAALGAAGAAPSFQLRLRNMMLAEEDPATPLLEGNTTSNEFTLDISSAATSINATSGTNILLQKPLTGVSGSLTNGIGRYLRAALVFKGAGTAATATIGIDLVLRDA